MPDAILLTAALLLLSGTLFFEKRENRRGVLGFKAATSALFILAALTQPARPWPFWPILIAALVLCFCGDVLLALRTGKTFLFGLVSFLLGHLLYLGAFFALSGPNLGLVLGGVPGALVAALALRWLWPHLGKMAPAVVVYVVVITAMLAAAWMVGLSPHLPRPGRLMIACGATAFFCSDLFVARERFVQKAYANRLVGLPLYYLGQFLLAFSPGAL